MAKQLGFFANPKSPIHIPAVDPQDVFLKFDSGRAVSVYEGCYNTIVLGSTGTGKTSSVILPAAASLIEKGYPGLIVDIKGNLSDKIRAIAKKRGRYDDIIEFGSSSIATRINILKGMSISQVRELLKIIAVFQFGDHTGNLDWHMKGVAVSCDCVILLRYLAKTNPQIPVSLSALKQILNDWPLAARIFNYFKDNHINKSDVEQNEFVKKVQSDNFNQLVYDAKKSSTNTYQEQTTWRLGAIRNGLAEFLESPSIVRNFATDGDGLDIEKLIYDDKKIVLLRFDESTGSVGSWMSRFVLTEYYKAVYARGLRLDENEFSFMIGDEFQEFASLNGSGRYNDNAFAAKAREFRAIQIIGTQSVSSLASRGANTAAVLEFMNNINNRIIMYCDDPVTQSIVDRYNEAVKLNELKPGDAFVIKFDGESRKHLKHVESMQKSHDELKSELPNEIQPSTYDAMEEAQEKSLVSIFDDLESVAKEQINAKQNADDNVEEAPSRLFVYEQEQRKMAKKISDERNIPPLEVVIPLNLIHVVKKFPSYFQQLLSGNERFEVSNVPHGWLKQFENALDAFSKTGLHINIAEIGMHRGALTVISSERGNGLAQTVLNKLLFPTRNLCPVCGEAVIEGQATCGKCLEGFGLATATGGNGEEDNQYML